MCVWQPLVYDAKSLSSDFYYGKKIEQRVCLEFCVSMQSFSDKTADSETFNRKF